MAIRLQLVPRLEPPDLLDLPWSEPLARWDHPRLVRMARGTSRHVVRFVAERDRVFALKEMAPAIAQAEYDMLRLLASARLPAVQAAGVITGRVDVEGRPLDAVLVTRFLDFSLPFRYLVAVEGAPGLDLKLVDAGVVLLARLHLDGFFWGDCSLNNLLFRRDAGALMAYLVDAETTERHAPLPLGDARRLYDLELARENIFGGLLDLQAAGRLGADVDAAMWVDRLQERYLRLWDELTGMEELPGDEAYRIEGRMRRLNDLGFDVEELVVERDDDSGASAGTRLRVSPAVVEEGHHHRELRRLTGLEVQENQARRLLNDIAALGGRLAREGRTLPAAMVAARWLGECYEPVVTRLPYELRDRLEEAEVFHEFLEHRWYLSQGAGRQVDDDTAVASYLDSVLRHRARERQLLDPSLEMDLEMDLGGGLDGGPRRS